MRFRVVNLGCKVNRVESDAFEGSLARMGFAPCDRDADVVVVNTCTVTAVAEKKTRKAVRQALAANPDALVLVTGCASMQSPSVYTQMSDRVEVVAKWDMEERLASMRGGMRLEAASSEPTDSFLAPGRARVGVKVQDGCANACTYCIVHQVRGPEVSTDPARVLDRCREAVELGAGEVVLTGINLGRYGFDGLGLDGLLALLLDAGFPGRIRLSSIEPDNLDQAVIERIAGADGRICRHLHLPLQSGSSKVLSEMGRRYDAEGFVGLVRRVRSAMPLASISTDVIAGFPGETEADFEQTMELCRACGFSKIHVFPYSEREGTPAAARDDQVPREVRVSRAEALRKLADELRQADFAFRRGTVEAAVVEDEQWCTTESYHAVRTPAGSQPGALVDVRL